MGWMSICGILDSIGLAAERDLWMLTQSTIFPLRMDDSEEISMPALYRGERETWDLAYPRLFRVIVPILEKKVGSGSGIDHEFIAAKLLTDEVMRGVRNRSPKSFEALKTFEDLVHLTISIAQKRGSDAIRKYKRKTEQRLPDDDVLNAIPAPEASGPDYELIQYIVNKLDLPKRQLLTDYLVRCMTYAEIVEARGIPIGTVCSSIFRGLMELRSNPEIQKLRYNN